MLEKKNTRPKFDNVRKLPNLPFFDLFLQILFFFRVSGFQTFPRKKKYNFIFFSGKKKYKILSNRVSEWGTNFSGKKKYDTFAPMSQKKERVLLVNQNNI